MIAPPFERRALLLFVRAPIVNACYSAPMTDVAENGLHDMRINIEPLIHRRTN